jgi:hypothetical protein
MEIISRLKVAIFKGHDVGWFCRWVSPLRRNRLPPSSGNSFPEVSSSEALIGQPSTKLHGVASQESVILIPTWEPQISHSISFISCQFDVSHSHTHTLLIAVFVWVRSCGSRRYSTVSVKAARPLLTNLRWFLWGSMLHCLPNVGFILCLAQFPSDCLSHTCYGGSPSHHFQYHVQDTYYAAPLVYFFYFSYQKSALWRTLC